MKSARLRERLLERGGRAKVTLTERTIDQIETYYLLLNHWNKRINLSALPLETMGDQAIDRVLIEPLVAAAAVPDGLLRWWDLGSGGGSPALPIRIVRPEAQLTLVEARSRKVAFLREAVRELALSNVEVVAGRFEDVVGRRELDGTADLVTVRAVRIDASLLDLSRKLLKKSGGLLLFATRDAPIPATRLFTLERTVELIPGGRAELLVLKVGQ
ncbi:MAG: 16S rRNA (guanine(527)-N(7))-methyltransferase RsmG [Acidobacteriota bacterium]